MVSLQAGNATQTMEVGLRDSVSVMVGGAPLTQAFADQIGADGYAYDAPGAAEKCKALISD